MRKWSVELVGDKWFLDKLANSGSNGDYLVTKKADRYFLESTKFEAESRPNDVRQIAVLIKNKLIAVSKLSSHPTPIIYIGAILDNTSGDQSVQLEFAEAVAVSDSVVVKFKPAGLKDEEVVQPLISPVYEILSAVDANPNLKRIIDFLENDDWTLSNMYRIVEVIVADEGGHHKFIKLSHIDENKFRLFKQTINNPELSGAQARHGDSKDNSNVQGLSYDEIKEMTIHILSTWLAKHGLRLP